MVENAGIVAGPLYFGDRVGRVRDPLHNLWWIQTHVQDVAPAQMLQGSQDPEATRALNYVNASLDEAMRA